MSANPPRRTNEQLAGRAARRAALTEDTPAEQIEAADLELAPPALVAAWMNQGKLAERFGVPPQKQHGVRR